MGKTATGQPMRSAERLLLVLSAFTVARPARSIAELSAELSLASSTVRRLVETLERHGYLRQDPSSGRYSPHFQVVRLAGVAVSSFDLTRAAGPILDRLAEQTGETVELAMRSGANAVVVSHRPSKHAFRLVRPLGTVYPCFRGAAAGKILFAWLPEARVREVLPPKGNWPGNTPRSITTARVLMTALKHVRKQGYATNDGETDSDVWVVAAPVRDHTDAVIAALAIPCLALRVSAAGKQHLAKLVCTAADDLSRAAHMGT